MLPFVVTDAGEVLFVLAKERYVPHWRGSSRWSGFEGGTKSGEGAVENAVREFCEESICIFDCARHHLSKELEGKDYSMRVNIVTEQRKVAPLPSLHATFVKRFEYVRNLPERFEARRKDLMALQQASESLDALTRALPEGRYPFVREGCQLWVGGDAFLVHEVADVSLEDGVFKAAFRLRPPGEPAATVKKKRVTMIVGGNGPLYASAQAYTAWFHGRARAEAMLRDTAPPPSSMSIERLPNGHILSLHVLSEFLEKSCIRYWTIDELTSAMRNRAHTSDVFRPYFVLVLRTVLESFVQKEEAAAAR